MFYSGICFGTNDLDKAGKFYDVVFKTINVVRCQTTDNEIGYGSQLMKSVFGLLNLLIKSLQHVVMVLK